MGKIKDEILKMEAEDYIQDEQKRWISKKTHWKGMVYNDLIDFDEIEKESFIEMEVHTIDGHSWIIDKWNILEINGVCIKFTGKSFEYSFVSIIPLDKVTKIRYKHLNR